MLDLKTLNSALGQLEEDKKISKEKVLDALEHSLAAAYKKEYGKKGQIIKADFDTDSGKANFYQVKTVIDPENILPDEEEPEDDEDTRIRLNPDQHILLEDAKKIKNGVETGEEISFDLEPKDDFGRIAAQTAKQVIIQKVREAEKDSVMDEFKEREGEIVSGIVQKIERGAVFVDFNRTTGILPYEEQMPGEYYRTGERVRAYLQQVEESPKGVSIKLSRRHPKFVEKLFEIEAPEIESGVVEIKNVAREAGSRTKIAVLSNDESIDPIGTCVGQKGVRVSAIIGELGGEKIDIIEYDEDPKKFVADALLPAKALDVELDEDEKKAKIEVAEDQLSLAIGKGGQNVRLAAQLTDWKIDIVSGEGEDETTIVETDGDSVEFQEEIPTEETVNETKEEMQENNEEAIEDEAKTQEDKEDEKENDEETTEDETKEEEK